MPCYYCGHPWDPGLVEVAHLISPLVRLDLSWDFDNLVPAHGAGKRRCAIQSCQLNCNWLAHNSPDAPKDENGADLPFDAQFLARQARARGQFRGKNGRTARKPSIPPPSGGANELAGREW